MRGKTLTLEQFIERSNKIHGEYEYSQSLYVNNKTKVIIKCPLHGLFKQTPETHLNGHKCPKCANQTRGELRKSNIGLFIEKSKKIFGNTYDYSKVVYNNALSKVSIICRIHGVFLMTPNDHLNRHGCPLCGRFRTEQSRRSTKETFIKSAIERHGTLYDYSDVVYKNNTSKVKIKCYEHGIFFQIPNNHLNGSGCPSCNTSKGEKEIEKYLTLNKIHYISQKKFDEFHHHQIGGISLNSWRKKVREFTDMLEAYTLYKSLFARPRKYRKIKFAKSA